MFLTRSLGFIISPVAMSVVRILYMVLLMKILSSRMIEFFVLR